MRSFAFGTFGNDHVLDVLFDANRGDKLITSATAVSNRESIRATRALYLKMNLRIMRVIPEGDDLRDPGEVRRDERAAMRFLAHDN